MFRIFFTSLCFFLAINHSHAQFNQSAADRKYRRATQLYQKGQVKKADGIFKEIVSLSPGDARIYSNIGKYYYDNNRFQDAAYYFEMGSKSTVNGRQIFALPLAKAHYRAGAQERAGVALRAFRKSAATPPFLLEEVQQLQKSIEFSRLVTYNTHNVGVTNLGMAINSSYDDYAPSFSPLNRDLVFTRKVNGIDENFFSARLDTCGFWSVAEDMGFPLNSANPESFQNRAYNDKYMIYQKCDNRSVNGWERGGCDLYLSYATKQGWSEPRPFGYTINTVAFEGMPSLSADESALYFVSDRPGGYGGKDIWVSYFVNGKWQVPENLGPNVNTEKEETAPSIAADGKTLFFSSNGRPGMGGFDIFSSKLLSDSSWTMAANLGSPINSGFDEIAGSVSLNGEELYFSSDQPGGYGGMDIYKAELPKPYQPKSMSIVYGRLFDFETKSVVANASVQIDALTLEGNDARLLSNKGDGSFHIAMPRNTKYLVHIEHPYYQPFIDTLIVGAREIDTLQYPLYVTGYEPVRQEAVLSTYDFTQFGQEQEDSICLDLNQALHPYSGKMVGIQVACHYRAGDSAQLNTFKTSVMQCFYKMGIGEDYVQFTYWESKALPGNDAVIPNSGEPGKAILKIEYLNPQKQE
ncbi:MAG: hypothetical protein EOP54_01485 [Sphingobacteriales bacterium]|nr:MAG: hypothetical protein EOP54_01485 [Sphingobacteriales bacterium]